ncbi:acyltransferase [Coralloluteibacterium thermophilus]|uniref:Acyltransferase n=1 Tax=Coralloluteibacterium thermophilum TaxID=2707049 RepID=A0ABV9NI65_9GAMM
MTTHWTERPEGGGRFALWLIRSIGLYGGRPVARLLLYPITLYFLVVRGPERRASRAYLSRVFGRRATLMDVARHIHCFASTILDRVFLLAGRDRALDIRTHGLDQLEAAMAPGRGVLLFGAHHGSFEALRVLSQTNPDVRVRVVFDKGQSPAMTCLLDALNPGIAETVIDARMPGTAIVLAIGEAAASGALIGLLADRARRGESSLPVPFLGSPAAFPTAPALIAAALKIPVVLCFGLYRGGNRYDLHFEHFADSLEIPRRERASALEGILTRYARRLEHHVRLAPYNWFNFFDFWQNDGDVTDASAAPDPAARAARARALDARRA